MYVLLGYLTEPAVLASMTLKMQALPCPVTFNLKLDLHLSLLKHIILTVHRSGVNAWFRIKPG